MLGLLAELAYYRLAGFAEVARHDSFSMIRPHLNSFSKAWEDTASISARY